LFVRRYPQCPAELAFDLFLGKPAILVEHHGYFRDGGLALLGAVQRLNASEPGLTWLRPVEACSRTCWKKTGEDGTADVRFYCDRFRLTNESSRRQYYQLLRQQFNPTETAKATINGKAHEVGLAEDGIKFVVELGAGESADIQVSDSATAPVRSPQRSPP